MTQGRLGRQPTKHDVRTVRAAPLIDAASHVLPAAPMARNWSRYYNPDGSLGTFIPLGTFNNMTYGDCTCAAFGHLDAAVCAASGAPTTVTTAMVLEGYDAISPWDRNNPTVNDDGAFNLDALRWFLAQGLIVGFASVYSRAHIETCINLFHGVYVGVDLPLAAKTQQVWDVAPAGSTDPSYKPRSWGGHCVGLNTRLLTRDLRWVPAGSVRPGDALIGFDENADAIHKRRYRTSFVEQAAEIKLPCYDLVFSDGTRITCSYDHAWLTVEGWVRADKMRAGKQRATTVLKPLRPWTEDTSRDGGYLAAAFDGEGWIDGEKARGLHKIGFTQRPNEMWDHVTGALRQRGVNYRHYKSNSGFNKNTPINNLVVNGRQQLLEFLGAVRPHRLLAKFDPDRLGAIQSEKIQLVHKEFIGEQTVMAMRTSTRTFLAEGLASHNSMMAIGYDQGGVWFATWGHRQYATWAWFNTYVDEAYVALHKQLVADGSKLTPAGYLAGQITDALAIFKS